MVKNSDFSLCIELCMSKLFEPCYEQSEFPNNKKLLFVIFLCDHQRTIFEMQSIVSWQAEILLFAFLERAFLRVLPEITDISRFEKFIKGPVVNGNLHLWYIFPSQKIHILQKHTFHRYFFLLWTIRFSSIFVKQETKKDS